MRLVSQPETDVRFSGLLDLVVSDSLLADRTSVPPFEPCRDALVMEPMQARQDDILFFKLVLALANGAEFVLLAEVLGVGFSELAFWKQVDEFFWDRPDQVFVKIKEALIFKILILHRS